MDTSKLKFGSENSRNFMLTLYDKETDTHLTTMLPARFIPKDFDCDAYNNSEPESRIEMTFIGLKGSAFMIKFS